MKSLAGLDPTTLMMPSMETLVCVVIGINGMHYKYGFTYHWECKSLGKHIDPQPTLIVHGTMAPLTQKNGAYERNIDSGLFW
jgi:hypothetical protein